MGAAAAQVRPLGIGLIVTSLMTRALQTAALLSRALHVPLAVEFDLHEWVPDLTFSWTTPDEVLALLEEHAPARWRVALPRLTAGSRCRQAASVA